MAGRRISIELIFLEADNLLCEKCMLGLTWKRNDDEWKKKETPKL